VQALIKARPEIGLWVGKVPRPDLGIDDVLIRVHKTGICGTDLHIYEWDEWARSAISTPLVIGHEFVGEVVEVGANDRAKS
jgi:threonine 3-dehydrogenase